MNSLPIYLGYKYFRSNKGAFASFTSLMAIAGLSLGVAALVIVLSVMNGFEKELQTRVLGVVPQLIIRSNENIDNYDQPLIVQDEIGILGFIVKKIDGILYFLVQAKIEPGNINIIQLSPTLQATKSNYQLKHGGGEPDYMHYFFNVSKENLLFDVLLSEEGTRFFNVQTSAPSTIMSTSAMLSGVESIKHSITYDEFDAKRNEISYLKDYISPYGYNSYFITFFPEGFRFLADVFDGLTSRKSSKSPPENRFWKNKEITETKNILNLEKYNTLF